VGQDCILLAVFSTGLLAAEQNTFEETPMKSSLQLANRPPTTAFF